jgi:hypothetical protein
MKRFVTPFALAVSAVIPLAGVAFATGQPGTTAGVNCEVSANAHMTPGHAADSPGAPFNEPGINSPSGGVAGQVYAGSGPSSIHAASPNAVSQYDVACKNVTARVP